MKVPSPRTAFEIARRGGVGILESEDLKDLNESQKRVLRMMLDYEWHYSNEVDEAAGEPGRPARRGLARLWELKDFGFTFEREKDPGTRRFRFRLKDTPVKTPVQVDLFKDKAA